MKRSLFFLIILSILYSPVTDAQVGKFLKNVKNAVADDLMGKNKNDSKPAPEPPCACDPATLIFDVGKNKIDYSEMNISILDDGRVLFEDRPTGNYYISKGSSFEGPISRDDPRAKQFRDIVAREDADKAMLVMYKDYISKQGDKYLITFNGKSYGPYGAIERFRLSTEKDKFAATVVENIVVTQDQGEEMEKAINNAKTEQEKIDLAMKYSQQMQQKIISGGGPQSMQPKIVSNVPGTIQSDYTVSTYGMYTRMKYNEIVLAGPEGIKDLQGKPVSNLKFGTYNPDDTFISSDNSRYAMYSYGTLTISDGKKLTELFNPHLVKSEGKIYLAYFYYSPKSNAIMECRIPF